jgi:HlyD family secretion protein/epimerase transport system membrane fusion protein
MTDTSGGKRKRRRSPSMKRPIIIGTVLIVLTFGGFGTWAAVAPLATGAVAQGRVAVEIGRQVVDHHEGGIVSEILVEEGDRVEQGDVLVKLSAVQTRAAFQRVRSQLAAALATEARLEAEKADSETIEFPEMLDSFGDDSEIAALKADEREVFEARRAELQGQLEILESRVGQLNDRIEGLQEQKSATREERALIREELESQQRLFDKGHATKARVLALQRRQAAIRGQLGQIKSEIAQAQASIGETKLQRIQVRKTQRSETAGRLTDVRAEIANLRERLGAVEDRLERTKIRAPRSGQVVNMKAHTRGGSIGAGQPIMYVVPVRERLVLEGRLRPADIDSVEEGMTAQVRITALPRRSTPLLEGVVKTVGADSLTDEQSGQSYYPVTVSVAPDQLAKLEAELKPGMPATVMINAGEKTLMEYLVEPWTRAVERAFREG